MSEFEPVGSLLHVTANESPVSINAVHPEVTSLLSDVERPEKAASLRKYMSEGLNSRLCSLEIDVRVTGRDIMDEPESQYRTIFAATGRCAVGRGAMIGMTGSADYGFAAMGAVDQFSQNHSDQTVLTDNRERYYQHLAPAYFPEAQATNFIMHAIIAQNAADAFRSDILEAARAEDADRTARRAEAQRAVQAAAELLGGYREAPINPATSEMNAGRTD